jgi:hypothetical protein
VSSSSPSRPSMSMLTRWMKCGTLREQEMPLHLSVFKLAVLAVVGATVSCSVDAQEQVAGVDQCTINIRVVTLKAP